MNHNDFSRAEAPKLIIIEFYRNEVCQPAAVRQVKKLDAIYLKVFQPIFPEIVMLERNAVLIFTSNFIASFRFLGIQSQNLTLGRPTRSCIGLPQ